MLDIIFKTLLIFVPIAFIAHIYNFSPIVTFIVSALAIIPLAKVIGEATEELTVYTHFIHPAEGAPYLIPEGEVSRQESSGDGAVSASPSAAAPSGQTPCWPLHSSCPRVAGQPHEDRDP